MQDFRKTSNLIVPVKCQYDTRIFHVINKIFESERQYYKSVQALNKF